MGRAVQNIVAIAAVIAIPFVAPTIAATIGLSGAIGATAGSALVGAGLGAATASITGGDVERGAIMGGIGGGIAGYNYTPTVSLTGGGAPVYDYNAATNSMVPAPGFDGATTAAVTNMSGYTNPAAQQAAGLDTSTFNPVSSNYTNVDAQRAAGFNAPPDTTTAAFDGIPATSGSGYTDPAALKAAGAPPTFGGDGPMGPPVPSNATVVGASTVVPMSFSDAIAAVPGELKAKFTDPKALADVTLRAAGALAGSYFAGDGMSDQEKKLIEAQTNELRALQVSNKALFDQKLQAAQDLIGESKYFDPEYFGLQRARKAQVAGAKAKRAGLRGLEGNRRASEERRFDLATGRDTGTAFDQGFGAGTERRLKTMQAGLTAMPGMQTGYGSEYQNISNQYAAADRRKREAQSDFGKLFGSFTSAKTAT